MLRNAARWCLVVGIAGLAVYFAVGPGGAGHRLTVVLGELGELGFVSAFVLVGCVMMVIGEHAGFGVRRLWTTCTRM